MRNLKLRTKLALIVAIPTIAALVVAVPGFRSRTRELDAVTSARSLLAPASTVTNYLVTLQDEGSLSAWWNASGDPAVKARLDSARSASDRAAEQLTGAARAAGSHGATEAAARIRTMQESAALLGQERQFVDIRIAPDDSVLGYFRERGDEATAALDAFVRAPRSAAAVTMFRDLATVGRLASGAADERSILVAAYARHALPDPRASDLVAAVALQDASADALTGQGRATTRAVIESGMRRFRSATDQVRQRRAFALTARLIPPGITAAQWYDSSTAQMKGWGAIDANLVRRIDADLAARANHGRNVLWFYALSSLGVLILAAVLAFVVARAIRRPLRQLADSAHDVAHQQLPALVDALQDEHAPMPTITPLAARSRDEIGALAKAFNQVERTTVEVAELQRQAVRSGISDLYMNLARRNQPLLNRQLTLIEDLEREERDPERLASLFGLDHLATRMRRNSESLLVLAGQDDLVTDSTPVPLLDVVRGAVSETTDFERIDTAGIPADVRVLGYAAADLAHAVSELLENATGFSPPSSRVVVVAQRTPSGVELTISDEGIGIAPARLAALNHTLVEPPLPGLALSHSLGLVVVARLAHRIGVDVTLRSATNVGTAAVLDLPDRILRDDGAPESDAPPDAGAPEALPDVDVIDLTEAGTDDVPAAAAEPLVEAATSAWPAAATGSVPEDPTATDAGASASPWIRPGTRPTEPAATPSPTAPPGPVPASAADADILPRRARHHRRRRARHGEADGPAVPPPFAPPIVPLRARGLSPAGGGTVDPAAPAGEASEPTAPSVDPAPVYTATAPDAPVADAPVADAPVADASVEQTSLEQTSVPGAPPPADDGVTTPAGLPRRTPHATGEHEWTLADAPPPRPPDAVFELVARYEAGRRRAGTHPVEGKEEPHEPYGA